MSRNRGKHPNDDKLFNYKWQPIFKEAVHDLSWLLTKGYGEKSATQLVGNRYRLNVRQQKALTRMAASKEAVANRKSKALAPSDLIGKSIAIDGFNLLIWLESALSGAYVFHCLDSAFRDIGGVHGSYKSVEKTQMAIALVGQVLANLGIESVHWYLDQPVSNSGRLKGKLMNLATTKGYNWEVSLVYNPDKVLVESTDVVISSDSWVLDETEWWFNLCAYLMENGLIFPKPPVVSAQ